MLRPEDAWRRIAEEVEPLEVVDMARSEALGLVLARAVEATMDLPQADVSAMDGYVLAGAAKADRPVPVIGVIQAGAWPDVALEPGQAAKIMTGAVVPPGGDRVVPIEHTDGGHDRVEIARPPSSGAHIRRRAEVIARGAPLLDAGSHLTPGALSLLAAHGHERIAVHRRPRVAVLGTGDEVVPPDREPAAGQLRDSNGPYLIAASRSIGLEAEHLGIAPDDRASLETSIRRGLESDVLLVSGGVSMGDFDFAEEVLETLGCRRLFDAVAVQPGKPLVAARHDRGWVLGLPGNPASVMMTFRLFGVPLLRRLAGMDDGFWRGALTAEAGAALPAGKVDRDRFLACSLVRAGGRLIAHAHLPRGSHDLAAYANGRGIVRIPVGAPAVAAGEAIEVLTLVDWPEDRV